MIKLMIPFTPHLSNECLDLLGVDNINVWPKIDPNINETIKFVVQINGKTRDIIMVNRDLNEDKIKKEVNKSFKAKKYIENSKVIKIIFIKNRIINYIIPK